VSCSTNVVPIQSIQTCPIQSVPPPPPQRKNKSITRTAHSADPRPCTSPFFVPFFLPTPFPSCITPSLPLNIFQHRTTMKDRRPQRQQRQQRRTLTAALLVGFFYTSLLLLLLLLVVVSVVDNNVANALSVSSPPHRQQQQQLPTTAALQQPSLGSEVWPSSEDAPSKKLYVQSDGGVDLELPHLPYVFDRILQVSPLARKVMTTTTATGSDARSSMRAATSSTAEYGATPGHLWKLVESSPLAHIDKIDSYQGRKASAPLLRFRSTLEGPCLGECFASFIMDYDHRKQWDAQIDQVYEAHSVTHQLQEVQQHMLEAQRKHHHHNQDVNWGVCSRFGVGYCRTKASIVSPREQLTMCGIQDFEDGSCLIWGVEMDQPRHEPLMPRDNNNNGNGKKLTRAKSHLFCTTLSPRPDTASSAGGRMSFDVEYVLQLEIGGKIPSWISGPVVTENVKQLLKCASSFYAGTDPQRGLEAYLLKRARTIIASSKKEEATDEPSSSSSRLLRPMETYMEGRRGLLMTF
jgi:hypothetical protein